MSNRSLLEFNHDYAHEISTDPNGFVEALGRYLRSADRESIPALERYGIHAVGFRHHSERYYIGDREDGFPVNYFKRSEKARA